MMIHRYWLLLVLVLLSPLSAQENPPAEPVRFVAYNVRNYLKMDRRVNGQTTADAPKPDTEIAPLLQYLLKMKPDILGVCEIGSEEDAIDLQARMKTAGIDLPHREYAHGGDPYRRLVLYSKFPIVARDSQRDLVYQLGDVTLPLQRGILDATVQINPTYQLRCLGIHFKSKREVEEGPQDLMRQNEAALLRAHVDKILAAAPETNLLAYGDFNDDRHTPTIKIVKGDFNSTDYLSHLFLKDDRGELWTYYWITADSYARFDYAFVNRSLMPEILMDQSYVFADVDFYQASDHRPLVVAINPVDAAPTASPVEKPAAAPTGTAAPQQVTPSTAPAKP